MLYKEQILKTLAEAPEHLLNKEIEVIKDEEFLASIKRRAGVIEKTFEADVLADSKKEEWKEALSNATKREAEKHTRLQESKEYSDLTEEINEKERDLIMKKLHLKHDERVWQSAKASAYLQAK